VETADCGCWAESVIDFGEVMAEILSILMMRVLHEDAIQLYLTGVIGCCLK
jgi:hypothetical protein